MSKKYNHTLVGEEIFVHVIKADDVRPADSNGKSDPYVVVSWVGSNSDTHKKTKVKKKTLNPVWDEKLMLRLHAEYTVLNVSVFDRDLIGRDDFLGQVELPVMLMIDNAQTGSTITLPLVPRENMSDKIKERVTGEITLGFELHSSLLVEAGLFEVLTSVSSLRPSKIREIWRAYTKTDCLEEPLKDKKDVLKICTLHLPIVRKMVKVISEATGAAADYTWCRVDEATHLQIFDKNPFLEDHVHQLVLRVFDKDLDHALSLEEAVVAISKLQDKQERGKVAFEMMDKDGAGEVDRDTLLQFHKASFTIFTKSLECSLLNTFTRVIGAEGGEAVATACECWASYNEWPELATDLFLEHVDLDKRGAVSQQEFLSWYSDPSQRHYFYVELKAKQKDLFDTINRDMYDKLQKYPLSWELLRHINQAYHSATRYA
ncbi:Cytosolic phospholipase A2 delta [Balamuthia mandrillaris]